jgi:hypothetical protein
VDFAGVKTRWVLSGCGYGFVLKKKGPEPMRAWPSDPRLLADSRCKGAGTRSVGSLER